MRATITSALLVLGLFATGAFAPKCNLQVETSDVVLDLNPNDYCGHSSVTIQNVAVSKCVNNGALCRNYHYRFMELLVRRCCVPRLDSLQNITDTVQVSNSDNSCTKTVTYTFANATGCKCAKVGEVSQL